MCMAAVKSCAALKQTQIDSQVRSDTSKISNLRVLPCRGERVPAGDATQQVFKDMRRARFCVIVDVIVRVRVPVLLVLVVVVVLVLVVAMVLFLVLALLLVVVCKTLYV